MRKILVTGGYGFIGSNLIRYWLDKYPEDIIINVDALTYAAQPQYLDQFVKERNQQINIGGEYPLFRYNFEQVDIRDQVAVARVINHYRPDHVIHLAAESHVCRSIMGPKDFVTTNINGTFNLLEEFHRLWPQGVNGDLHRFHHVSTDEVFGALGEEGQFNEDSPMAPTSPYAASKAGSDALALSYYHTYGVNVTVSNCSNNFGPNQHHEKLIPKCIKNLMLGQPIRIYGSGKQVRDWIYVMDHCAAIDAILHRGVMGQRYCVGGNFELPNIELTKQVFGTVKQHLPELTYQIQRTADRPTDDFRYAIDCMKIMKQLGWHPCPGHFQINLNKTVKWYLDQWRKNGQKTT